MQVKEIIQILEKQGYWVNWDKTRDHLIHGDLSQSVNRIGVCWMATFQVIQEAQEKGIDFLITHENPFYMASTQPNTLALMAAERKKQLLSKLGISVYRCHDVWDCIENVGVSDMWANRLGFSFDKRQPGSYNHFAEIKPMTAIDLCTHVAHCLVEDGQNGAWLFGRKDKVIRRLAIGTGAATDVWSMLKEDVDAVIVSDDGVKTFSEGQYLLDHDKAMIMVSHAPSEIAGIKAMAVWLQSQVDVLVDYIDCGYEVNCVSI